MEYTYRFRIYPNLKQRKKAIWIFGCCRYVYNHYLDRRRQLYQNSGFRMNSSDCIRDLPNLKKENEWLKGISNSVLQNEIAELDHAFQTFFKNSRLQSNVLFPKKKRKRAKVQHYSVRYQRGNIRIYDKAIRLPNLGLVKCRVSKPVEGDIQTVTVTKTASGVYFVSLYCRNVSTKTLPVNNPLSVITIHSTTRFYPDTKSMRKTRMQLANLRKQLSRKTRGSCRERKLRMKIDRLQDHLINQRNDLIHKKTTQMIRTYDLIYVQYHPSHYKNNNGWKSKEKDLMWRKFSEQLNYKAKWYGKKIFCK